MNFADALREEKKWTVTENGQEVKNTTENALLDLFASIGALRSRDEDEIIKKFIQAMHTDKQGAVRCAFYARDVRGGLGERNTFRVIYKFLANELPEVISKYLYLVPEYGRYDDFYALLKTKVEDDMWEFIKKQLMQDKADMEAGKPVSLLAKWLKKADSRTKDTKRLGIYTAKKLGMSVYDYKRLCNKLRKYIDVTEIKMTENKWGEINYPQVPSKAMLNYRNAFRKHDEDRYEHFIEKVESGEEKINASTLYPYDIIEKCFRGEDSKTLDVMWDAMPDFVGSDGLNAIVMADVSGSMSGRPMATSVGLAIYFAQRNHGAYKNLFMTFSGNPSIVDISGVENAGISKIAQFVRRADWGMNTDLDKAFRKILQIAKDNEIAPADMPKALIVISDMEIDEAAGYGRRGRETYSKYITEEFAEAGYTIPKLVFWNVDSRHDTFLADANDANTILVSGQSASTFKSLMQCLDKTPIQMMYEVLNSDRYNEIVVE